MATHLILCREFRPAPYAPGGIGTYVANMAQVLAEGGETVHVVGQQWAAAPAARECRLGGRLTVHRVPIDAPTGSASADDIEALRASPRPERAWSWNATLLAESLIETEGIDVVEAQDFEAPLAFLLHRRAQGLGPARTVPCIVHLHSPSEFVWRYNGWPATGESSASVRDEEEWCLLQADALLCPSAFLAREAAQRYGIAEDRITVIPYPLGTFGSGRPAPAASASGPVVYVGRLEPRKGLLEFIEAAVAVAHDDPLVHFRFVGSDVTAPDGASTLASLRGRIPRELSRRFRFKASVPRPNLVQVLATARFAVVPSRWDNFPTCTWRRWRWAAGTHLADGRHIRSGS